MLVKLRVVVFTKGDPKNRGLNLLIVQNLISLFCIGHAALDG